MRALYRSLHRIELALWILAATAGIAFINHVAAICARVPGGH